MPIKSRYYNKNKIFFLDQSLCPSVFEISVTEEGFGEYLDGSCRNDLSLSCKSFILVAEMSGVEEKNFT